MKDARVKWRDTRWGYTFAVFCIFTVGSIVSGLFGLVEPWYLELHETSLGIRVSFWHFMVAFSMTFGAFVWLTMSAGLPRYREYVCMPDPFLVPYDPDTNRIIQQVEDSKRINVEWKDNPVWDDVLTVKEVGNSRFVLLSNGVHNYYIHESDLKDILTKIKDGTISGRFTFARSYSRFATFYTVKYLGE